VKKEPQNINAWTCIGVAFSAQGKRQRVRAKVADGGNPIEHGQGKSFLQETPVMPGQMTTHVYGLDSTHVYGQVYGRCLAFDNLPLSPAKVSA
jgi:hypothetical protein